VLGPRQFTLARISNILVTSRQLILVPNIMQTSDESWSINERRK